MVWAVNFDNTKLYPILSEVAVHRDNRSAKTIRAIGDLRVLRALS
jgi:hypothetical protein